MDRRVEKVDGNLTGSGFTKSSKAIFLRIYISQRDTERVCVRACVRACVRVCVCVCERERERGLFHIPLHHDKKKLKIKNKYL